MATKPGSESWACEVFKRFCSVAAIEVDLASIKKNPPDGKMTDVQCRIRLEDHWFEFCECIDGGLADNQEIATASLKNGGGVGTGGTLIPVTSLMTIKKHLDNSYPDAGGRSLLAYFERQGPFGVGLIKDHLDAIVTQHLQPTGRWMSVWLYSDWPPGRVLAEWHAPTSIFRRRPN